MNQKTIIICGGVGPMAGVNLHKKIIEHTQGVSRDQDHLSVIHISDSAHVSDRTAYLIHHATPNPGEEMFLVLQNSLRADIPAGVVCVPCNTFHAPEIVSVFVARLQETFPQLTFVHIEESLTKHLLRNNMRRVGVLSTTGSRVAGIYRNALRHVDIEVLEISDSEQALVQESIYNPVDGIKALSYVSTRVGEVLKKNIVQLRAEGAELVILGCTELSFVVDAYPELASHTIDTVSTLADALIVSARE